MKKTQLTECQGCGSRHAQIIFIPQYKGYRGHCFDCDTNWPES